MTRWVEVSVCLTGEEFGEGVLAYSQRINYEYFQNSRPDMVQKIVAVVNDLPVPQARMPFATTDQFFGYAGQFEKPESLNPEKAASPEEINAEFDKEYALHKART